MSWINVRSGTTITSGRVWHFHRTGLDELPSSEEDNDDSDSSSSSVGAGGNSW